MPFFHCLMNLSLLCLLLCPTAAQANQPELEWCLDHLPPRQIYLASQQPTGPMVDLMQQLARQSGFTLKFSPPTPSARCLKLMQQGKTDLMTGLLWSAQREQFMLLLPFDNARPDALFSRHQQNPLNSMAALNGKTIALAENRHYPPCFYSAAATTSGKNEASPQSGAGTGVITLRQCGLSGRATTYHNEFIRK